MSPWLRDGGLGRSGLVAVVIAVVASSVGVSGLSIHDQYRQAVSSIERDALRLASVLRGDIGGRLLAVNAALVETALDVEQLLLAHEGTPHDAAAFAERVESTSHAIRRRIDLIGDIEAVRVVLRDGALPSLAVEHWHDEYPEDAPYIRAFLADPARTIHVGLPFQDIRYGFPAVVVARRIDAPDGRLAGAVAARLAHGFFASGTTLTQMGPRDVIGVWRDDGEPIARFPFASDRATPSDRDGSTVRLCPDVADGPGARLVNPPPGDVVVACAPVVSVPVTVAVTIDRADALAAWRAGGLWHFGSIAAAAALIVWLTLRAWRRFASVGRRFDDTRDLLRSVVDALPAMVTVRDADLRYTLVNRTFAEFFETTPQDCIGRRFEDVCRDSEGAAGSIPDSFPALARGRARFSREWSCTGPDGRRTRFVTTVLPRSDESDTPRDIISVSIDVTSIHDTQQRLAESERLLQTIVDVVPVMISVKDAAGRYLLVNRANEEFYGFERASVLGRTLREVVDSGQLSHLPLTGPDSDWHVGIGRNDDRVLATGETLAPYEVRRFDRSGASRVHLVLKAPLRLADGVVGGVVTAAVDVTSMHDVRQRLAESERVLQTIVDAVPVMIAVKDTAARFVLFNRASEAFYGVDRDRVLGRTITELVASGALAPPTRTGPEADWHLAVEDREQRVLTTGEALAPYEIRRNDRSGATRTLLILKVPLKGDGGRITGAVTVAVDVTELKESQQAALEAKELAEFANRAKSEFLANMSHELRTPLNAVIGFGQMMEMQAFGPLGHERYRDYARHVVESANHLMALIGDILDVASIELGRIDLKDEPVDIASVVKTCVMMLRDKVVAGGLTIDADGVTGLPRLIADRRRVLQIMANLLGNAIKFTPPDGHVTVSGGIEPDGGLCLRVTDTGIGMAEEEVELALEPFKQVDNVFVKRFGGAGLGLPIARRLAALHDAAFAIHSVRGEGTTVEIRFPPSRVAAGPAQSSAVRLA